MDHFINLDFSGSTNETKLDGVVGDADALGPGVFGVGLGATTETKCSNKN